MSEVIEKKDIKPDAKIEYTKHNVSLLYNVVTDRLHPTVSNVDVIRYLKGVFINAERFEDMFLSEFRDVVKKLEEMPQEDKERFRFFDPKSYEVGDAMDRFAKIFDDVEPLTYAEVFELTDQ